MVLALGVEELIENVPRAFHVGLGPQHREELVAAQPSISRDREDHQYRQAAPLGWRTREIVATPNESDPTEGGKSEHGPSGFSCDRGLTELR